MIDYTDIPSPCFVLNEESLRSNLLRIKQVKDNAEIDIILAFKGFAMWASFPLVREYINGATASSLFEARLCFEEMKTRAHVYAPVYLDHEFDELASYSSHIVFNSIAQFQKHYSKTRNRDHSISCGLRVNPEYSDVKTDLYNPASPTSRLGILREHLPDELPSEIEGLHFHVLCESSSYSLEKTLLSFEDKFGQYLPKLKWVNMGGGHLMTQKDYNVKHLVDTLKKFKEKHQLEVILEPGSAFAWQTGVLISEVQDIVQSRGVKTAMLDVSFTAHMPDTLEMPYRPSINSAKDPTSDSKHLYRLGGASCLAGDYMEVYDFGRELKCGDRVIFEDMIHYTMVKTTMFNGINHPSIAILDKNNTLQIVRKFKYEDYKSRLS